MMILYAFVLYRTMDGCLLVSMIRISHKSCYAYRYSYSPFIPPGKCCKYFGKHSSNSGQPKEPKLDFGNL
jgi:hypothetical protein